ncbi:DUF72 domain-containing protein [Sphingomonas panacisoli]|uniref:DUF72 domain-containing protein n=1 Tax=Sphingomonas panacisoli TaxID=1813879 RepID=UPI0019601237|nr:DUF72 domain-containing protein [Sphingomonas panacisoli]
MKPVIGTAGWSITREQAAAFPDEGTALERYAKVFRGVEVNSSFHRPHRPSTWARWASSVPAEFRFAVKMPKTITHQNKLVDVDVLIERFADEVAALGSKLSVVLVQLPPKLVFEPRVTAEFFENVRQSIDAQPVCEPRHTSWFGGEADDLLSRCKIGRVAADPALGEPRSCSRGVVGNSLLAIARIAGDVPILL